MADPTQTDCSRGGPSRRAVLAGAAGLALSGLLPGLSQAQQATGAQPLPEPTPQRLPRWRGFNLLEKFHPGWGDGPFNEADFDIIAEWGFDFVRLPCSYWCWARPRDLYNIREEPLAQIDQAVQFGRQRGIHVNINFHRIPGYCVNQPAEPTNLFRDEATLDAACFHWATFAERYKGIPNREVSFDLMNEPPSIDDADYLRVHGRLAEAIRKVDPERLIICDGKGGGHTPVGGLEQLKVAASTRGYHPFVISHYKASWIGGSDRWPRPTWPLVEHDNAGREIVWDKERLRQHRIEPWKEVEARGVGVHIGEWGAHNLGPHDVVLAWMKDNLELFEEAGWGWALWNLRGSFGVLDSERRDVSYETFRGHKLDRKMLALLQEH